MNADSVRGGGRCSVFASIATLPASNAGRRCCAVNPAVSIQSVQPASDRSVFSMEIGWYPLARSQSAKAST